jgi:2-keto-4-pentenoate hydratase/2-oxohepta-3-ene-1,7-dioic acid hydratase in catechol pathway
MRFARLGKGAAVWARLEGQTALVYSGAPWAGGEPTGQARPFVEEELLAPVEPFKILCVGRNYAAHAKELGNEVPAEPLLFLKPKTSLVGHGGVVVLPPESSRVEHEAELGVVIGKTARRVSRETAMDHVFGYTCVCDVPARDLQRKDGQWTRAKGFDTFCPAGPWIETDLDPAALRVRCLVNDSVRQDGNTSQMVFDVAALVAYASGIMTLEPGDLLVTGTPEGVGPLVAADRLVVEIQGIGALAVKVAGP